MESFNGMERNKLVCFILVPFLFYSMMSSEDQQLGKKVPQRFDLIFEIITSVPLQWWLTSNVMAGVIV